MLLMFDKALFLSMCVHFSCVHTVESHNEIAHSECLKDKKGQGLYIRMLCPLCTSYKMVSNPVDLYIYANACNQPSVFLAPSQGKSNLLWLLAETPLILEPLLIYGMQMHHLQSILRCEKVIGRPCVLPCNWMICINYYSLCSS